MKTIKILQKTILYLFGCMSSPEPKIKLITWEFGEVAEILHIGSYDNQEGTVERLKFHISANGYEVSDPHEEE